MVDTGLPPVVLGVLSPLIYPAAVVYLGEFFMFVGS